MSFTALRPERLLGVEIHTRSPVTCVFVAVCDEIIIRLVLIGRRVANVHGADLAFLDNLGNLEQNSLLGFVPFDNTNRSQRAEEIIRTGSGQKVRIIRTRLRRGCAG